MTSVKVKFRASASGEGVIYYQIIHDRRIRQLATSYRILHDEWDNRNASLILQKTSGRYFLLTQLRDNIRQDIRRLNHIVRKYQREGVAFSADEIIAEFRRYASECTLFSYMSRLIASLRQNGKIRTAETYTAARNSFRKFLAETRRCGNSAEADIMPDAITGTLMEAYQAWHKARGNSPNTISFYNRILRAVYRRIVDDELTDNRHPFRRVYTGIEKTVKRAIPLEAIAKLRRLDLSGSPHLELARDMFLMSFYLRGISFIDLAMLRKTDLVGGILSYRRRKTGQMLHIRWTAEMQQLLDKYPPNITQYLMPIITKPGINPRNACRNAAYRVNQNLKTIARMAGMTIPLTTYVARHSWASAAKAKGVPLAVISEGMGHDSETTTRIYLASLSTTLIDQANALIIQSL